jgi:hypothetical protein
MSSVNALDLYLEGAWFESCLGHCLHLLKLFIVFLSSSIQVPGKYLNHEHFVSIYYSPIIKPFDVISLDTKSAIK